MTLLFERAPAKINLSLLIHRRRSDGYHELESLVAFSGSGDVLSLQPGGARTLSVSGPCAKDTGPVDNNLVLQAAQRLRQHIPDLRSGAFHLYKNLPAASGIGGGSSDAAAALRLLARSNDVPLDDPRLLTAAASIGADVPVCLAAQARMMSGIGDALGSPIELPPLYAALVNPGVALETKDVFARLNLVAGEDYTMSHHPLVENGMPAGDLLSALRKTRNDMEDAASVMAPVITDVLAVLGAARGCKLARMSGSGATCFGLFETRRAASRAARTIRKTCPGWWVKACVLR
ncbi:MAG: 4-(cytidine 5'-diphospho)-2-C-methyl-D-erythritol kinase [Beijerinckiaceae bacterium]|jgi:4-diphosphocytidyl-2-C-methyl-D-erythritol kinase|nr:4-(cytidine 5'-diphospho)-2-C-methyl-D-erythritol kinase [Beijerinckiaceae bacterium]